MAHMVVKSGSAYRILMMKLYEELLLIRLRRISKVKLGLCFMAGLGIRWFICQGLSNFMSGKGINL
jgi:hypothetical protein